MAPESGLPESGLGAVQLRDTMVVYRDLLHAHREVLNRLNVYPVPDGDTGTNMALTLDSVVAELEALAQQPVMPEVCEAIGHGSLMGARGNSGVILSQLLRGVGESLTGVDDAAPGEVAKALTVASDLAERAVVRPVEGTILTVAREAAEQARQAAATGALLDVLDAARRGAGEALARTPELLPVLAKAGVVDAGGAGLVLFFDALLAVMAGRPLPAAPVAADAGAGVEVCGALPAGGDPGGEETAGLRGLRYEVMYLLEAPDDTIPAFKDVWAGIGDSIVVVGGGGLWKCHIHTDDIGAAVEAGIEAGRPHQIRVTDLLEQVEEERWVREAAEPAFTANPPAPEDFSPTTAAVAVVNGLGVGRIFRSLGAYWQVVGGQTRNPSTAQLLEAVEACPAEQVVVLPNNSNAVGVAEQVDSLTRKQVRVVPTGSIVEGFAALLAYDPAAGVDGNVDAMTASARRVVPGEVTRAVRDADTPVGRVRKGDWIGLSREGVVASGASASAAVCGLLQELVADEHELVTIIEGEEATAAETRRITEWLHDTMPQLAIEVHHGGQPLYPYLLGIE